MALPKMHWREDTIHPEPVWSVDPDISIIESISRHHLLPSPRDASTSNDSERLTVTFLGEGAFNKAYTVSIQPPSSSSLKSYIFRATLPLEPTDKALSEVATLDYIKKHTSIPVPTVIAYDASSDNALGFEWILMEKMDGVPVSSIWRSLGDDAKDGITREIASYVLQMRQHCTFDEIGALYYPHPGLGSGNDKSLKEDSGFTLGPIVTQLAFMTPRGHLLPTRPRGPYQNDREFVTALIDIQVSDIHLLQGMAPDDPGFDEDLYEDAVGILRVLEELGELVGLVFSDTTREVKAKGEDEEEEEDTVKTVLTHPDLTHANILISPRTLRITGIIDWECSNAVPVWVHPYPSCLVGPEIDIADSEEAEPERVDVGDEDELRNERWDEWERGRLRGVFDEVVGPPPGVVGRKGLERIRLKREFLDALATVEVSEVWVGGWVEETREKLAAAGIDSVDAGHIIR